MSLSMFGLKLVRKAMLELHLAILSSSGGVIKVKVNEHVVINVY